MNLDQFRAMNLDRCESEDGFGMPIDLWTNADWLCAVLGELGEAANIAKKLTRGHGGIPGNSETDEALHAGLAEELADTFIYLDLIAARNGINLSEVVAKKWNKTSEKIGYPFRLDVPSADAGDTE